MSCNLTAQTKGSLNALTQSLLQANASRFRDDNDDQAWVYKFDAEASGSLEASMNPVLEASVTHELQAKSKITLNARLCIKWPNIMPPP